MNDLIVLIPELTDFNLQDPELEEAATRIQAAYRGHRTRKGTNMTTEQEEVDIDLNDPGEPYV